MTSPALLVVENEKPFHGVSVGKDGLARGHLVAATVSAGFTDLLTDPVYSGKLVCFTSPHVGNSGVVPGDLQSDRVAARGVIAKEFSRMAANRLGVQPICEFLAEQGVPAIEGVDTRSLAEIVARRGMVRAVLGCGAFADPELLTGELESQEVRRLERCGVTERRPWREPVSVALRHRVVVHDFGVKRGFLTRLAGMGCAITLVPGDGPADATLGENPAGVVFSAGPGVPADLPEAIAAAAGLIGKVPLWGIGIGAGIVAEAAGATTVVNNRGRFGAQPVGRTGSASGEMAMHCQEFWIEGESLVRAGLDPTHHNLNDGAVAGFACGRRRLMGVLFHPEAEPGPRDSLYLFDRFHHLLRA
ncbi:MAG: carbamoyl phosphate synthase small subunit [Planctomycetes bacterium]|nr:carbamoyl phosphate synthase small subunit [Planctomycetota bacterium]